MKENDLLKTLAAQLNVSEKALGTDNPDKLMNSLDDDTSQKVRSILDDPQKTKALLDSPEAKKLMELLNGNQ